MSSFSLKAVFGFAAAAAIAAGLMGMGSADEKAIQPGKNAKPSKKSYSIGMVAKSTSNPVFIAAKTGAEEAARDLGKKYGVSIKIDWRTPTSEDGQKQAEYVEQLANSADGIALSASDANKLKVAIDAAVAKGVEVVTFDSDVPASKRFAYYGTDDFECGKAVAAEIAKSMGGKGVVAILAGNQNAPNLQTRVRGVREGLKDMKGISVLDTYYHVETPQDAVNKMEQVQGANPQITGWALVGGWPLNTSNALDKIAGKAKVVSVDALPPFFPYIKSGQVDVLLGQKVYDWGYQSVTLIMEKLIDGKSPKDPIVKAPLDRVTKQNVEDYAKNWEKWAPSGKKDAK
jgi:ribose transport system substrate-binding protein